MCFHNEQDFRKGPNQCLLFSQRSRLQHHYSFFQFCYFLIGVERKPHFWDLPLAGRPRRRARNLLRTPKARF